MQPGPKDDGALRSTQRPRRLIRTDIHCRSKRRSTLFHLDIGKGTTASMSVRTSTTYIYKMLRLCLSPGLDDLHIQILGHSDQAASSLQHGWGLSSIFADGMPQHGLRAAGDVETSFAVAADRRARSLQPFWPHSTHEPMAVSSSLALWCRGRQCCPPSMRSGLSNAGLVLDGLQASSRYAEWRCGVLRSSLPSARGLILPLWHRNSALEPGVISSRHLRGAQLCSLVLLLPSTTQTE